MSRIRRRARELRERVVDEILGSKSGSDAIGAAVKRVQAGKRTFDENTARLLGAMGLATVEDLDRVSRKIGRLRKRLNALLDRVAE